MCVDKKNSDNVICEKDTPKFSIFSSSKYMRKALEEKNSNINKLERQLKRNLQIANDKQRDTKLKDLEDLVKKWKKKKVELLSCTRFEDTHKKETYKLKKSKSIT